MSGEIWSLITIVGPILLGAVLLLAVLNNRRSKSEVRHTDAATRANYAAEDAAQADDPANKA